jgi:long-subunit acyl-CoA synthetase (AMP-forming)
MTNTIEQTRTVCDLFAATASERADQPALRTADGSVAWTWSDYADEVAAASAGLHGLGVRHGDTVALWLSNRPEFHVADMAAMQLGAAPFSIYSTFTVEQAEHVVGDAGSRVLVTEPAYLANALALRERGKTALERIVLVEGGHTKALSWSEMLAAAPPAFDVAAASAEVQPDDLATLIYTSGTTGAPKGVELTHRNVVAQCAALTEAMQLEPEQRAISWLPMAHIAERLCTHYIPMQLGWSVTCLANPRAISELLREVRPQYFFSPPRLWEKMRANVISKLGPSPDPATALAALGLDAVTRAVTGAAPCPAEVVQFWHTLGLPLYEVYGLSETTGVATVNAPGAVRIGSVGRVLPGVEVTLSGLGEVLIRGAVVMRGYRNRPDATADAIDSDGWLHTGDIGTFDDDGYLRIVDRIKELIISAAGKNMSPANIEATIKSAGSVIGTVCTIGDGRPYNVALVTIDSEAALTIEDPELEVAAQIERANERLARVEQIKRFTVLPAEWVPGGHELTPTMKLKRRPISEKYAAEIEALYTAE